MGINANNVTFITVSKCKKKLAMITQTQLKWQGATQGIATGMFFKTQSFSNVPVADVGKRLLISDVIHEKDAHSAAIVSGGDGT